MDRASGGTGVAVTVRDTGSGIAGEALPRIFDRSYQAGAARPEASSGHAGLGLAIVKTILDLHGSSIAVRSDIGRGTTVTFTLPFHRPAI